MPYNLRTNPTKRKIYSPPQNQPSSKKIYSKSFVNSKFSIHTNQDSRKMPRQIPVSGPGFAEDNSGGAAANISLSPIDAETRNIPINPHINNREIPDINLNPSDPNATQQIRNILRIPQNSVTTAPTQFSRPLTFPTPSSNIPILPPNLPYVASPQVLPTHNPNFETNRLLSILIEKMDKNFNEIKHLQNPIQSGITNSRNANIPTDSNHRNLTPNNLANQNNYVQELECRVSSLSTQVDNLMERLNSVSLNPSFSSSQQNQSFSYKVHPHKWNVKFSEKSKIPVDTFIFQITTLKEANGVSWDDVLSCFHLFLEGSALTWYWRFRSCSESANSWEALKEMLIKKYRTKKTDEEIFIMMASRKQGEKEKFIHFYEAIEDIHSLMRTPTSDKSLMKLITSNVKSLTHKFLLTYKPDSLEEFIETCEKCDKLLYPQLYQNHFSTSRQVADLLPMSEFSSPQMEAFTPKVCKNCGKPDHYFKDCDQPIQLSCFKCNKKGFTVRTCPDCNPNFRMIEELAEPPPQSPIQTQDQ